MRPLRLAGIIGGGDPLMFASNRQGSMGAAAANSGTTYACDRVHYKSPPYPLTELWICYVGFTVDSLTTIEHPIGNDVLYQGATLDIGNSVVGTFTDNGATSWTVTNGGYKWVRVIANIPANTDFGIRTAAYVPNGNFRPQVARVNLAMSLDGTKQGSTDRSGWLTGSPTWDLVRQTNMCGPAMIVGRGWLAAGKPAVPLIVGDSIGKGNNDTFYFTSADGLFGYIEHGLNDAASSTRMPYCNLCIPGVSFSAFNDANFVLRKAAFDALPNRPFTSIISEMGTNAGGAAAAISGWPAFGAWLKTFSGGKPIVQTTMLPKSSATSSSVQWSTLGNQVKIDFGSYNTFIRGLGDANMNNYIDIGGAFESALDSGLWAIGAFSTTVNTDFVSGTNQLILNAAPAVGATLFVGTGTGIGGALAGSSCIVQSVSGSGPYTVTLQQSCTGTAVAGTAVVEVNTTDGVHPSTRLSVGAGAAAVIAAKNASKIV